MSPGTRQKAAMVNVKTVWKSFLMCFSGYGTRDETSHDSLRGYTACNGQGKNEVCQEIKLQKSGWVNAAF